MKPLLMLLPALLCAQTRPLNPPEQPNPVTLIPQSTIDAMVNEISGTLSLQSILDLAGYEHNRAAEEYRGTYRETAYLEKMAKQYGLEDAHIERFKTNALTWDGEVGELWVESPVKRLVVSYRDVAASLAPGSRSADVTAEMVYVGRGERETDYTGKDVAGKLVLASGSPGTVHNLAVRRFNAAGVISFNNPTGRPIDRPDEIAWNNLGRGGPGGANARTTFAFNISHRMGMDLIDLLERGNKVTLHAKVVAAEYDADMQVATAVIRGTGESDQEIAFTGHVFEGIAKQGAMDDASGCAAVLEMARAWKKLIDAGVLPRPRRTIRFLWVPEIQGTNAYLNRFPEEARRIVAAVSMDMVGESVTVNKNSLRMMRTPYSTNHFINDVTTQFFEYVGDTNREKVQNRSIAYGFLYPILDPQGSRDPFYYNIEKHYGSSDHAVFLNQGIAAVLFNNWPDWAYHTSEDRPSSADPTQLKRSVFIGLASGQVMANASGPAAVRVAETVTGYSAQRAATELRLALQMIGDGGSYREARNLVEQAYIREGEAIRSVKTLAEKDAKASRDIEDMAALFASTGRTADLARVDAYAKSRGAAEITLSSEESEASGLIPLRTGPAPQQQNQGGPGQRAALTGVTASEARAFADGKRSILDIRDAVSAEFGPQNTKSFLDFFRALEKTGEFGINPAPARTLQ